jgi:hypothetical protein
VEADTTAGGTGNHVSGTMKAAWFFRDVQRSCLWRGRLHIAGRRQPVDYSSNGESGLRVTTQSKNQGAYAAPLAFLLAADRIA